MVLQNFWDNIRTPGFVDTMFEDLAYMCNDTKKETVSLMKEGEEDFTIKFRDIIISEGQGSQNCVLKKIKATGLISKSRSELLAVRGFPDSGSAYIIGIVGRSLHNAATSLIALDRGKIDEIISQLKTEYRSFPILNPEELVAFADQVNQLLDLPSAPQYPNPYPENETTKLDAEKHSQRLVATHEYLSEAIVYVERLKLEITRQQGEGILFDHRKIEGESSRLLEAYERRLCLENMSLKYLAGTNEDPCREDWMMVRLALLLTSGIHAIVSPAIIGDKASSWDMSGEMRVDLISGLDEVASRYKGSILTQYLSDIEEINKARPFVNVGQDRIRDN